MIYSAIGLVLLTALMGIARKRNLPQTVYIPLCLAAGSSGAVLFRGLYITYFGSYNLYFYIVTALILGLIIDLLIRKTVSQDK